MKYIKSLIERNSNKYKLFININRLIFVIITVVYLFLIIINQFLNKIFKEYLNINAIFILLLIDGILFLLPRFERKDKVNKKRKIKIEEYFLFLIMSLICSVLVWIKIKDFGVISYIISTIAGLITLVSPILLFYD